MTLAPCSVTVCTRAVTGRAVTAVWAELRLSDSEPVSERQAPSPSPGPGPGGEACDRSGVGSHGQLKGFFRNGPSESELNVVSVVKLMVTDRRRIC